MKKFLSIVLMVLFLTVGLSAVANTTSSSKASMTDATGGWWYSATTNYVRQTVTVTYVAGTCSSITLTAGVRFTNDAAFPTGVTYYVPIISAAGVASSDPITISAAGSYTFVVLVPQAADRLYVYVAYASGADATVNINAGPDIAF
jgi:hypothetical protein